LFCVKTYDTESAARLMLPALHEQSVVLPVQNGLTTTQTLTSIIGRPCVLEGLARISAVMTDLNVVEHLTQGARIELGEPLQTPTGYAEAIARFLCEHGVDALIPPDIQLSVWLKFLDVTSIGVGNALTRLPLGEVMAVPESRAIVQQSLSEIVAVGRAYGVNFAPDAVERSLDYISRLPGHIKTSLLVDLEQGRRLEVEALSGAVVRLGEARGIPTPLHRIVLGALLPSHLRAVREKAP